MGRDEAVFLLTLLHVGSAVAVGVLAGRLWEGLNGSGVGVASAVVAVVWLLGGLLLMSWLRE